MGRFFAGAAAAFLMLTGALLIWQGRAQQPDTFNEPPPPLLAATTAGQALPAIPDAPSADPKTKEQKRFARVDKNDDGRITLAELVEPRRKPFAKLDVNGDGKLSFEEWTVKTIDKFNDADGDKNKALTAAEYATTAPKKKAKKPACSCG